MFINIGNEFLNKVKFSVCVSLSFESLNVTNHESQEYQHLISPYKAIILFSEQVVRIKKIINRALT